MKNIALHILDLVQNSISAGGKHIDVKIEENVLQDLLIMSIQDDGKGMSAEFLERVRDPYTTTRTTRKVGMGIPLLHLNTMQSGGRLKLYSEIGKGTLLQAFFGLTHIDRIPLGDIAGVIVMTVAMNPSLYFTYTHTTNKGEYIFDTKEVKEALGDIPINEISIQKHLKELIEENLKEIGVGV